MNRGTVLVIMLLFFLYFSVVAGKIIADVDGSLQVEENEGYGDSNYSQNFAEPDKSVSFS